MSTPFYDLASLVVVPSGYKASKVYAQKPLTTDGQLTFSRASTATRVNSAGLIEKVRTNLAAYSEQFDNAYWVKTNTTVVANSSTAPNGTTTAELVYPTTTGSNRLLEKSFSISSATPYTGTWYLKASGLNWVAVDHIDGNVGAWFNLSTGTIGTIAAGTTASIENVGNGWYRCRISKTSGGTTGYHDIRLVDGDNVTSVTANGTDGVLVWGAQLETGDIATDYIATTSAAVSVGPVANVPRLDYLNSSCPRLLLEPQRTNLQIYSENSALWQQPADGLTVVYNTTETLDPAGFNGAEKVTFNSGTGRMFEAVANSVGPVTMSAFVKAGTGNIIRLRTTSASILVEFNLTTQTITSTVGTGTITNYGNGWYRVTATGTSAITPEVAQYVFPNSAGQFVYFYGAQFENGAYATSYIPTLGAAVTRLKDNCVKTGVSSLIGQTEGTVFVEFKMNGQSLNEDIYSNNKNLTGSISLQVQTNGRIDAFICYNGTFINLATSTGAAQIGQTYKIALAYKSGSSALYVNGTQIATSATAFAFTTTLSEIDIANNVVYFGNLNSKEVKQVLQFTTRLTNAQLAELTTL